MATQSEFGAHVGISRQAVSDLVARQIIPLDAKGRIDLDAARLAYCAHLRGVAAGRTSGGDDDLDLAAERARLAKAQADAQEMKNAAMRAEMVPASQVVRAVSALIGASRSRLLGIPARAAAQVVGIESRAEVRDILAAMVREACQELSQRRVDDELGLGPAAGAGDSDGDGDVGAAAGPDGEPVG